MIDDQSEPGSWAEAIRMKEAMMEAIKPGEFIESDDPRIVQIGGDHYRTKAVQPWDAMAAWMDQEEFIGFLRGNVIKYVARAGSKGDPVVDYKKAHHYLDKLIGVLENGR